MIVAGGVMPNTVPIQCQEPALCYSFSYLYKLLAHMSIGAAPPPGAWPGLYRVSLALCADPLLVPTGALQVRFVYGCAAA